MHIIGGKFQRRSIHYPKDRSFRPTKSIVRESLFNIIGSRINGATFLDGCSGSGAVGLEAESRGANGVVCVDKNTKYLTLNKSHLNASINIVRLDLIRFLKTTQLTFDIIFLDPVWAETDVYINAINLISERNLLNSQGILFVEHDRTFNIHDHFEIWKQYQYGNSYLSSIT